MNGGGTRGAVFAVLLRTDNQLVPVHLLKVQRDFSADHAGLGVHLEGVGVALGDDVGDVLDRVGIGGRHLNRHKKDKNSSWTDFPQNDLFFPVSRRYFLLQTLMWSKTNAIYLSLSPKSHARLYLDDFQTGWPIFRHFRVVDPINKLQYNPKSINRHQQTPTDTNRHQQTPTDTNRHQQTWTDTKIHQQTYTLPVARKWTQTWTVSKDSLYMEQFFEVFRIFFPFCGGFPIRETFFSENGRNSNTKVVFWIFLKKNIFRKEVSVWEAVQDFLQW